MNQGALRIKGLGNPVQMRRIEIVRRRPNRFVLEKGMNYYAHIAIRMGCDIDFFNFMMIAPRNLCFGCFRPESYGWKRITIYPEIKAGDCFDIPKKGSDRQSRVTAVLAAAELCFTAKEYRGSMV